MDESTNTSDYGRSSGYMSFDEAEQIVREFRQKFESSQRDLSSEEAQMIENRFWDLLL